MNKDIISQFKYIHSAIEFCGKHPFVTGLFAILGIIGLLISINGYRLDRKESYETSQQIQKIEHLIAGDAEDKDLENILVGKWDFVLEKNTIAEDLYGTVSKTYHFTPDLKYDASGNMSVFNENVSAKFTLKEQGTWMVKDQILYTTVTNAHYEAYPKHENKKLENGITAKDLTDFLNKAIYNSPTSKYMTSIVDESKVLLTEHTENEKPITVELQRVSAEQELLTQKFVDSIAQIILDQMDSDLEAMKQDFADWDVSNEAGEDIDKPLQEQKDFMYKDSKGNTIIKFDGKLDLDLLPQLRPKDNPQQKK